MTTFFNTGWWFGTFLMFPYIWNNHPNWLIFFQRGRYTTNQMIYLSNVGRCSQSFLVAEISGSSRGDFGGKLVILEQCHGFPLVNFFQMVQKQYPIIQLSHMKIMFFHSLPSILVHVCRKSSPCALSSSAPAEEVGAVGGTCSTRPELNGGSVGIGND